MHTGTGVNGASWVGGGWYVQNTSLQEMSEQSDDNHLNKKDFVVSWIGQTTEVFQVKGTVFSFRDHVKNWLKTTESWEAHNFKSLPHNYVVRTNSFPSVKLNKKNKKMPSMILASISKSSTSSTTFSCGSDLIWSSSVLKSWVSNQQ